MPNVIQKSLQYPKNSPFYMAMMNILFHVLICTSGLECKLAFVHVAIDIVVVI